MMQITPITVRFLKKLIVSSFRYKAAAACILPACRSLFLIHSFFLAGRSIMLLTAAQYTENCGGHRSKGTCNKQDFLHTHLLLPERKTGCRIRQP